MQIRNFTYTLANGRSLFQSLSADFVDDKVNILLGPNGLVKPRCWTSSLRSINVNRLIFKASPNLNKLPINPKVCRLSSKRRYFRQ